MNTVYLDNIQQNTTPLTEIQSRHSLCRRLCREIHPQADGIMAFSPLSIYYLTGTLVQGLVYIPLNGDVLLLVRENTDSIRTDDALFGAALARARRESPLQHVHTLPARDTWRAMQELCRTHTTPLGDCLAVEMGALAWAEAQSLQSALPHLTWTAADNCLLQARARKSPWELEKMRTAGAKHNEALCHILPRKLADARRTQHPENIHEYDIARIAWDVFFQLGHSGVNRMGNFGEECFLGHIAAGDNGNYPSHFNGPLGLKGAHPATPYMGHAGAHWQAQAILATDMGFVFEGYHTDKTQVYFSGTKKHLPDAAKKAHEACIEIQQRAAEQLRAGAIPAEIWADAAKRAKKLDIEEGFMGLGKNKVPFLGHGIGLVIDEWPVLAPQFLAPLEQGMTLAIEPKVGIKGIGMVGVENTFEVTKDGGISITGNNFDIICDTTEMAS